MTHLELADMIAEARQACGVDAAHEALDSLERVLRSHLDAAPPQLPPAASGDFAPEGGHHPKEHAKKPHES